MKSKTCCITGHREINDNVNLLKKALKTELIKLIKKGVIYFGVGGARGFDTIAALTIIKLRKRYKQIKLILVLPCMNQTKGWNKVDIELYEYIKSQADKIRVLSDEYYDGCMLKRNQHLVNCSSVCLCYNRREKSGTSYTVFYAKSLGLEIIEI